MRPVRFAAARGDRGAMNMVIVPVVVALIVATLFLIRNVGGAVDDSRRARTAADAAALAAAGAWSESVETEYYAALGAQEAYLTFAGRRLTSFTTDRMRERANYFAAQNGAAVVSFTVHDDATVTVRVRDGRTVPDTGQQAEHQSTAQLQLESGACRSGSVVGYRISGACLTEVPPSDPTSPDVAPRPLDTYSAQVILVG